MALIAAGVRFTWRSVVLYVDICQKLVATREAKTPNLVLPQRSNEIHYPRIHVCFTSMERCRAGNDDGRVIG